MSQVIDLCEGDSDSDDNGGLPKAASIPLLPLCRKRVLDNKEGSFNYKNATGSAEFVVDLELAEVEVSPHKKRRGAVRSGKNEAARNCLEATKKEINTSKDAERVDHRESHQGIAAAAAASRSMNSD
jgi:hypothetical protein